jgi:hypothetical protein
MHTLVLAEHAAVSIESDPTTPQKRHAELGGTRHELRLQHGAANTEAKAFTELSFDTGRAMRLSEANAAKWSGLVGTYSDAQTSYRHHSVWHQAFAAGFIDRKTIVIGHGDTQATLRGQDCRGKPGRTPTEYENIRRMCREIH